MQEKTNYTSAAAYPQQVGETKESKEKIELREEQLTCTYNMGPDEIGKVDPKNTETWIIGQTKRKSHKHAYVCMSVCLSVCL